MHMSALTPVEITVEFTDVASFQRLQLQRQERQEEKQRRRLEYEQPFPLHYQGAFSYQQQPFQQQYYHYEQPQYPPSTQHQNQHQHQHQLQHQQALFYQIHQHPQTPAASAAAPPQPIAAACDDSGDGACGLCDHPDRCRNGSTVPAAAMACGAASHVAAVNYGGCAAASYTALPFSQQQQQQQQHLPCGCTANGSYDYDTITGSDFATVHPPQQPTSSATSLAAIPPAAVFLTSTAAASLRSASSHPNPHNPHAHAHALALPSSPLQIRHRRLRLALRRQAKADNASQPASILSQSQPHASLYLPLALNDLQTPLPHHFSAMAVDLPEMTGDSAAVDAQLDADQIAADIAAQEALARDYQPDVTGPAVGGIQSTDVVKEHYATADAAFAEKTETLPAIFPLYRSILGDGNCGWRAIGFCYFEALIHSGDMDRIRNEHTRLLGLNDYIRDVGHYSPYVYEDMVEETDLLFAEIINAMPETDKAVTALTNIFNDANSGNAIIYHLRLLVASYLKGNAFLYQDFLIHPDGLEGYCQEYIERPNCEIDHVRIEILSSILLKPPEIVLEIAYLDRSGGSNVPIYRFPQESNNREESSIGLRIALLFRPDHYDILYRPGLPSGPSPDASAEEGGSLGSERLEPVEGAVVHTILSSPSDTAGGQAAAAETSEPPSDLSPANPSISNPPPSSTDLHVHHTRVNFESLFPSNTSSLGNYANLDMRVLSLIPGMMTTASARPSYSSSLGSQSPWAASAEVDFGGSLCSMSTSASHAPPPVHMAVAESPSMASGDPSVAAVGPALKPADQYAGHIINDISMEGAPISYAEALDTSIELPDSVHLHAQHQMHLPPHQQQQFQGGHTPEPAESHPVRFTKWQYERSDVDNNIVDNNIEPGCLRSSRLSTAHFSNPEFQPEEYRPAGEDGKLGTSRGKRKVRRPSSEKAPNKN